MNRLYIAFIALLFMFVPMIGAASAVDVGHQACTHGAQAIDRGGHVLTTDSFVVAELPVLNKIKGSPDDGGTLSAGLMLNGINAPGDQSAPAVGLGIKTEIGAVTVFGVTMLAAASTSEEVGWLPLFSA